MRLLLPRGPVRGRHLAGLRRCALDPDPVDHLPARRVRAGAVLPGPAAAGRTEAVQRLQGQVGDLTSQLELEQDAAAELRHTLARINADFRGRPSSTATSCRPTWARARRSAASSPIRSPCKTAIALPPATHARGDAAAGGSDPGPADGARPRAAARRTVQADKEQIELQLGQLQPGAKPRPWQKVRTDLEARVAEPLHEPRHHGRGAPPPAGGAWHHPATARARSRRSSRTRTSGPCCPSASWRRASCASRSSAQRVRAGGTSQRRDHGQGPGGRAGRILTEQIAALSQQLAGLDRALDLKQSEIDEQNAQIANLGQRLNLALASKVEELSQYRSEFFGSSAGRWATGRTCGSSATGSCSSPRCCSRAARPRSSRAADEPAKIAAALKEIIDDIPTDLPGVAGRRLHRPPADQHGPLPVELGTVERARDRRGRVPDRARHLGRPRGARGFAEFQPLDPGDDPDAYRRNRRIEPTCSPSAEVRAWPGLALAARATSPGRGARRAPALRAGQKMGEAAGTPGRGSTARRRVAVARAGRDPGVVPAGARRLGGGRPGTRPRPCRLRARGGRGVAPRARRRPPEDRGLRATGPRCSSASRRATRPWPSCAAGPPRCWPGRWSGPTC